MIVTPTFGKRLRRLRRANNWTQEDVSGLLSMVRSTYAYYETDKTFPDYKTLIKIANLFDVSTDYLLGNESAGQTSYVMREDAQPQYKTDGTKAAPPALDNSLKSDNLRLLQAYNFLDQRTQRRLLIDLERLALIQYNRLNKKLGDNEYNAPAPSDEEKKILDDISKVLLDFEEDDG